MKRPIIVGIDPGTTTAVAVLSINKEILLLESARKMGFDTLLSRVIEFGIPLVVGCDKKDVPDFVSRFAAKTGARIKPPQNDILVSEKRELAGTCKNDHERDALASAYYAYRQIQSQLTKILKQTEDPEIITLVVKHDFSIRQATDIVNSPDKPEKKIVRKAIQPQKREPAINTLYGRIKDLGLENQSLRSRLERLHDKISILEKTNKSMARKDKAEEIGKKEKTIHNLKKSKAHLKNQAHTLKSANDSLTDILVKSQHNTLVKVLEDLSSKELKEKSFLQISKGDVLFVKDPRIISKTTKKTLDSLDLTVIAPKRPSLNAIFIPETEIQFLNDHPFFLLIDTKSFRKTLARQDLIGQIVDDYRRTR